MMRYLYIFLCCILCMHITEIYIKSLLQYMLKLKISKHHSIDFSIFKFDKLLSRPM